MNLRRMAQISAACLLGIIAGPASAQVFGPDAYGYTVTKVAVGTYVPISTNPSAVLVTNALGGASQDDVTFTRALPFTFNFYGAANTQAFVSTNGFIAFGGNTGAAGSGSYLNAAANGSSSTSGIDIKANGTGGATVERAMLQPYWDDLFFTNSVAIPGGLYQLDRTAGPLMETVFEWSAVQYFGATANTLTFQAILRSDGTTEFDYLDTSGPAGQSDGQSASVGIHDLNGGGAANRYVQVGHNTAGEVTTGNSILITAVPEPTSMAPLGVVGLGFAIRRRFSKTA